MCIHILGEVENCERFSLDSFSKTYLLITGHILRFQNHLTTFNSSYFQLKSNTTTNIWKDRVFAKNMLFMEITRLLVQMSYKKSIQSHDQGVAKQLNKKWFKIWTYFHVIILRIRKRFSWLLYRKVAIPRKGYRRLGSELFFTSKTKVRVVTCMINELWIYTIEW